MGDGVPATGNGYAKAKGAIEVRLNNLEGGLTAHALELRKFDTEISDMKIEQAKNRGGLNAALGIVNLLLLVGAFVLAWSKIG